MQEMDDPRITEMELFGYPREVLKRRIPTCPVCGEECETIYRNGFGAAAGCNCCLTAYDAWEDEEDEQHISENA